MRRDAKMTSIACTRVNHLNMVLQDFDASVDHFRTLYGADFLMDLPHREVHAGLIEIGRVIFEMFVPYEFLTTVRYGPHYIGIEYQADVDVVRKAIAERGIRIVRDIGIALHTHPADGFGVALEFYGGYFHDNYWELLGGSTMRSVGYWRDEHPLGLTGLKAYSIAVHDIDAASAFFRSLLGGEPVYEMARPAGNARGIGLQVADAVIELIAPVGEGALQRHLHRYGDGIRSVVFGCRDIEQVRRYFDERGIALVAGDAPGSLAVPAEANLGVIFEFSE
jgi:hypothetical protein